jgi:undecaprenyl-diphosphatase
MADTADAAWAALLLPALFLGAVEGLTEFLPVSSTGHLIVLIDLLGLEMPPGRVLEVAIQSGAILAVCVLYFQRLFDVATSLRSDPGARAFLRNILLTSIPAAAIGLAFQEAILAILFDPRVVAVALIVGGIAMLAADRVRAEIRFRDVSEISPLTALAIGAAQSLALVPGVSRSAATIIGALLLGVERKAAAEYSFFAALPVLFGAAGLSLAQNASQLQAKDFLLLGIGTATAFVFGTAAIRLMLSVVGRLGFAPFAIYRIVLGAVLLVFLSL